MKKKKDDSSDNYRYINNVEKNLSSTDFRGVFGTEVVLSGNTLKIAQELGAINTDTLSGQVTYLKQTPEFAKSVLMDTAISSLNSTNIQDYLIKNHNNGLLSIDTSKITGNFYTTNSGIIPLNIANVTGRVYNHKANDISGIMSTGIAVEGVNNLNHQIGQIGGRLYSDPYSSSTDWARMSGARLTVSTQSNSVTTSLQNAYQTIGTSFATAHTLDIQERAIIAMEAMTLEQKRNTEETVRMREELSKSNKLKEDDIIESRKLRKLIEKFIKGEQKQLRNLVPQLQIDTPKDIQLYFDENTKTLSDSSGKTTSEITGQSLRLLRCFLESPEYKCERKKVIQIMGGEHPHSGAKNSLKSLLRGVAKIESIRNKSNAREVEFMQLVSE